MYFKVRRVIDFILALLFVIVLLPLFALISILIKLDSKGCVVFVQDRIGRDFKPFKMYKFRSMIENAQNMGTGVYSFAGDPRITRVGAFLRKSSLDELPQLWNVIKGDMAFVGPRAPVVGFFPAYEELNDKYKRRFTVLPGITGLSQVMGRNELSWDEKIEYDNEYINNVMQFGLPYDVKIWMLTVKRVLSMKGVEETVDNMKKNNASFEYEDKE